MIGPFEPTASGVVLRLGPFERAVLGTVPDVLDEGGDADGRLDYTAHPDDPAADARYRDLVAGDLDSLRAEDRDAFQAVASGEPVDLPAIEAFMRVIGEARLVLAARLGIEEDGWELDAAPDDPDAALLGWLGWLQDSAVALLSRSL